LSFKKLRFHRYLAINPTFFVYKSTLYKDKESNFAGRNPKLQSK